MEAVLTAAMIPTAAVVPTMMFVKAAEEATTASNGEGPYSYNIARVLFSLPGSVNIHQ